MSRHRKRPAPKHQAPGRRRRSKAPQARARVINTAVRRVVVTPTFAAGLGVVVAAVLAYPMTRTVISYGGTPPVGGSPCPVEGCVSGAPGDGSLATASPGTRLAPPSAATRPGPSAAPGPGGGGAVASGPQPVMQYQTLRQWQRGFIGEITITDPGGSAPGDWQLRLAYESAHIIGVWGGQWSPRDDHTVLVTPDSGGEHTEGGDGNVQVILAVSGSPGPPSECAFDGQTCRVGRTGQLSEPRDSPRPRDSSQPTDQLRRQGH